MPKFTCSDCGKELSGTEVLDHTCAVGSPINVPDVVGEVTAFRSWYVEDGPDGIRLISLNRGMVWRPKTFVIAACTIHKVEQVPHQNHTCGIYAAKDREHLVSMSYNRYSNVEQRVIGEVALSGRVIPGTQGYRAQKARPTKIYVPHIMWRLVGPLEDEYGIPVVLDNTLLATKKGAKA